MNLVESNQELIGNGGYLNLLNGDFIKVTVISIILIGFFIFLWKIFFSENKENNDKYIIALIEVIVMIIGIFVVDDITMSYFVFFGLIILFSLKKDWFIQVYNMIAGAGDGASKFLENHHKDKDKIKEKTDKIDDNDLLPTK